MSLPLASNILAQIGNTPCVRLGALPGGEAEMR